VLIPELMLLSSLASRINERIGELFVWRFAAACDAIPRRAQSAADTASLPRRGLLQAGDAPLAGLAVQVLRGPALPYHNPDPDPTAIPCLTTNPRPNPS